MADLRDFTGKNRKFTGTIGERISTGTTAERDVSFGQGTLRFNTTTTLLEYYDGTQWKPIDAPPTIVSVSPATFASDGSTLHTITLSGSNFGIGLTAKFIGQDGTQYTPGTVTRVSSSSVTMTTLTTMTVANEPYDVQITNASGLAATLENALDAGSSPAFTASAGSLGTLPNGNRVATALTSQTFGPATDADGQQINYTITSGSLPPGLRLGTANDGNNGKILGTATAVVSNTTSSFTISATDGVNTASRAYSITVNAPSVQSYTSTGAFTFTVPSGVSSVDVLVVAGGGGGGTRGGGGGAGGLIYRPGFPVTPGGSVPGSVGGGGAGDPAYNQASGTIGQDSVFGALTAKGGGFGAGHAQTGGTGGSGGGGGRDGGPGKQGPANQPGQPGDSGTYGFGNPGGTPTGTGSADGGGGGGAGAPGANGVPDGTSMGSGRSGGIGKAYDISGSSIYYAGGGGAGSGSSPAGTGGQGGGGQGSTPSIPSSSSDATANRGGGGGSTGDNPTRGGNGGSGIVIIKY